MIRTDASPPADGLLKRARMGVKDPIQAAFAWAATLPLDRRRRGVADIDTLAPRRIVASRLDHVGDLLVSTPLLYALHQRWPDARLVLVYGPKNRQVLEGLPFVEPGPMLRPNPASWARVTRELAREPFDLAVGLRAEALSGVLVAAASRAPIRMVTHATKMLPGYNLVLGHEIDHHVTRYCHAAAVLGVPCTETRPVFVLPERAGPLAAEWLSSPAMSRGGPTVGVQIPFRGSGPHLRRAWPLASLIEFSRAMVAEGVRVVLCGMPTEDADIARIQEAAPGVVKGPHAPLVVLGFIQRAAFDVFVSGSTGALHLAYALGVPTVALATPLIARFWSPIGPMHRGVIARAVAEVPVAGVLAATRELLALRRAR